MSVGLLGTRLSVLLGVDGVVPSYGRLSWDKSAMLPHGDEASPGKEWTYYMIHSK